MGRRLECDEVQEEDESREKRGSRNECTGSLDIGFIRHRFSDNFAYYIQGGKNSITKKSSGNWNLRVKTGKLKC